MSTAITRWRDAADILGISEDTLARRRKACGDRTRFAWWRDEEAVRSWYVQLIAPPEEPPAEEAPRRQARSPAPRRVKPAKTEAIDLRQVVRDLTR